MNIEEIIANVDMSEIWPVLAGWGAKVAGSLVALFFAWIIAGWARRSMLNWLGKRKLDLSVSKFLAALIRYLILVGAILGILGMFGVETASFAAVIAAGGLAIGLAFQGTLSNFAAGVMLLVFRPFKVGDVVQVAGHLGIVEEIELFTSEIKSLDNKMIVIPNSSIFGSVIENFTHHPIRRCDISVGVTYSASVEKTREILEAVVKEIPGRIEDPESQVFLEKLGASSVDWVLRVWCNTDDYWDVHQATIERTKAALEQAEIAIPFPQMDVHLDK
ncbi:MAG: mechanosensitive ion channel [Deltaproteobacteria bacterium]|nr:mechanosensitive ion channel [Deltaproteobacteria bacterium]